MKKYLYSVISGILLAVSFSSEIYFFVFVAIVPLLFVEDEINKQDIKFVKIISVFYPAFFIWISSALYIVFPHKNVFYFVSIVILSLFYALAFGLFAFFRKKINNFYGYFLYLGLIIGIERSFYFFDSPFSFLVLGNILPGFSWYSLTGALGGSLWILLVNLVLFSFINEIFIKKFHIRTFITGLLALTIVVGLPLGASVFLNTTLQPKEKIYAGFFVNNQTKDFFSDIKFDIKNLEKLPDTLAFVFTNTSTFDRTDVLIGDSLNAVYNFLGSKKIEGLFVFDSKTDFCSRLKEQSVSAMAVTYFDKTGAEYYSKHSKFNRVALGGKNYKAGILLGNDIFNGSKLKYFISEKCDFLAVYTNAPLSVIKNRAAECFEYILVLPENILVTPQGQIVKSENNLFVIPALHTITYYVIAGEYIGNLMIFLSLIILMAGFGKISMKNEELSKTIR